MSAFATKVRATEMLDALRGDRFKVFPEGEFIALGVPYELRQSTRQKMLKERAAKPYNEDLMPTLPPAVDGYLETLRVAVRETKAKCAWAKENVPKINTLLIEYERVVEYVNNWTATMQRTWDGLSDSDRIYLKDPQPVFKNAGYFPNLADGPYPYYPGEETPERQRQIDILEQTLADARRELGEL